MTQPPSPADRLYETGMQAFRAHDSARARVAWTQALRQDPTHARAWAALLRVCHDLPEQLYCLIQLQHATPGDPRSEVALGRFRRASPDVQARVLPELRQVPGLNGRPPEAIGPSRARHVALSERAQQVTGAGSVLPGRPVGRVGPNIHAVREREREIASRLDIAARKLEAGDETAALQLYLAILQLDPAQPQAVAQTTRLLSRRGRLPQAHTLLVEALAAGNRDPVAYLTVAQIRLRLGTGDPWEPVLALRQLPALEPEHLIHGGDLYWQQRDFRMALEFFHQAERLAPRNQAVLMRLAEAYRDLERRDRARQYLQRVVDQGARTELGRKAEAILLDYGPHIPRYIQAHMLYALREVLGIFLLFGVMAILDAGMNVRAIDPAGWVGLALSLVGAYLLVSATSSPAQRIFQRFLPPVAAPAESAPGVAEARSAAQGRDGFLPEMVAEPPLPVLPFEARAVLGTIGAVLLAVAGVLVLRHSLLATQETLAALDQYRLPDYLDHIFAELFAMFD